LPSNGRCLQSHYLATGLHATILTTAIILIDEIIVLETEAIGATVLSSEFFVIKYQTVTFHQDAQLLA
jgi:hypothetical protein